MCTYAILLLFKKDVKHFFRPGNNLVKDENGDLLPDTHNILNG
jgi:hypothetical protein